MEEDLKPDQIDFYIESKNDYGTIFKLIVRRAASWYAWRNSRELLIQCPTDHFDELLFKNNLESILNDSRLDGIDTLLTLLHDEQSYLGEILTNFGFKKIGELNNIESDKGSYSFLFYCLKL